MSVLFARRCYPVQDGDTDTVKILVRPELCRFVTYVLFWVLAFSAKIITALVVEPMLQAGSTDEPTERKGCGPFNRDNEVLGNSEIFGLSFGDGFALSESHLVEAFGFGNICSAWDYSPAREWIGMGWPFFEYAMVVYLVLDFTNILVAYKRGLLPKWFIALSRIVFALCMVLAAEFRMIFIFIAYENIQGHTGAFLGFQVVLLMASVMNAMYVLLTGQSYPTIGLSKTKTKRFTVWYLVLNLSISAVKIYGTIYIVFLHPHGHSADFYKLDTPFGDIVLGQIIDWIWMFFNALLPGVIAYFRMQNELPLEITIAIPEVVFEQEEGEQEGRNPPNEANPLVG